VRRNYTVPFFFGIRKQGVVLTNLFRSLGYTEGSANLLTCTHFLDMTGKLNTIMLHAMELTTSSSGTRHRSWFHCCRKSPIEDVFLVAIGQIISAINRLR
jgi:hypothetical protein